MLGRLHQWTAGGVVALSAVTLLLRASVAPPGAAEPPDSAAGAPAPVVIVPRTARMLDVIAGKLVADPVVVEGERIAAVGTATAPPEVPEGDREVDDRGSVEVVSVADLRKPLGGRLPSPGRTASSCRAAISTARRQQKQSQFGNRQAAGFLGKTLVFRYNTAPAGHLVQQDHRR